MDKLRRKFLSEQLEQEKAYWLDKLSGELAASNLPLSRSRPDVFNREKKAAVINLDAESAGKLITTTNRNESLIFTILVAAVNICLAKYSGVEDVIIGSTIHESHSGDALLNKTLVLRSVVSAESTARQLLQDTQRTLAEAYSHQRFPFESLLELLDIPAPEDRAPLFNVVVLLDNFNNKENICDLKNDVTLAFSVRDEQLTGSIEYNASLFDEEAIETFAAHFNNVLRAILRHPDRKVSQIELLSEEEKRRLLFDFNRTRRDYPAQQTISELFEQQAALTPDATALIFDTQRLTYRELNERANQLAHYLRAQGVSTETLVGLLMERSVELVVGLLGILKAGGAYVPLDVQHPRERLEFMLEDTQAAVLVTQQGLVEQLPEHRSRVVCLDTQWAEIALQKRENLPGSSQPNNLAYISYTSGSTGQPKGVSIPQQAVVRLVKETDYVEFRAEDCFLQLAPLAFDASTFEIWGSLLNGARLVLMPPHQPSLIELGEAIKANGVTTLWLTAGLFHLMVDERLADLAAVSQLLAGGDVLSATHVQKLLDAAPGCTLINGYGPTENTTFTCCYKMSGPVQFQQSVPIGSPIANTQVYVLDEQLQPVPFGVAGELCIGGDGLARGYFNQPQLTAEKFIPHPFSTRGGERLYRSGDLVRYRVDGIIEFVGRKDQQVKVRGFRIELGEVEAALGQHDSVRECVVTVRAAGSSDEKRLVAYVVPQTTPPPETAALLSYLKEKLPEYMMPSAFVMLDSLPLTANGKVDRRALPEPEVVSSETKANYVAPRNELEALMASIWKDMLGAKTIGVYDNFFEIGGHSLLATRVMLRVQQVFGVELALWKMFEQPTIAEMAAAVNDAMREGASLPTIEVVERPERIPLSYAQQRLWFLDSLMPGTALYNVYTVFQLGSELNVTALERSLNEIIKRHEILRTIFPSLQGQPAQKINEAQPLDLQQRDLSRMPETERDGALLRLITEEALLPFDLEHGPLVRATLIKKSEQEHLLLLTMHHIISDGWSEDVLARELAALYESFSQGTGLPLEDLKIQYADYAVWQRRWLQGEVLERQLQYWKQQLAGAQTVLELPADKPRPLTQTFRGARYDFEIPENLRDSLQDGLRALSQSESATLFMTLLAAFSVLLSRYSGQAEVLVGTPIANRSRGELEGLIGFLSNTLVIRTQLDDNPSFRELVRNVRKVCLEAYAHQDVPFERLVEELEPERDLSRTPLFQTLFSLHRAKADAFASSGPILKQLRIDTGTSKVDLSLYMAESEHGLKGAFEYNTDLFEAATIERLSGHFLTLLQAVCTDPEQRISELPLLTDVEQRQLLVQLNATGREYPREQAIQQLFEQQATLTPDATALIFDAQRLTYRELNERANQLAHYLRAQGVSTETLVGLLMERSVELVVGLLGILKAGGAYVPLDVQHPRERLEFMLEDTRAAVLVTQQGLVEQLPAHRAQLIVIDREWAEISQSSSGNPNCEVTADNLAYVIYTSGSTGKPKGICVTHKAVSRLVLNTNYVDLGPDDHVAQVSNSSFDAATFEIWGGLLNGGQVEIIRKEVVLEPSELGRELKRRGISAMFLTTALFNQIAAADSSVFDGMKQLLVGGEALEPKWVRAVLDAGGPERLLNAYGPTENTTFTTWYEIAEVEEGATTIPIGWPISNTEVFILNEAMQLVPVGVRGELYIGGDGLARGYLDRPELTAEKFVPHPFSRDVGARLYKTGDVCRYRPDGSIEFQGRIDHQVKIRGFRIELGEIEAVLAAHEGVKEAIVIVVKDELSDEKRIVAYVAEAQAGSLGVHELRSYLKEKLPEYMVPTSFVLMDALPLTANGKIDRAALPEPDDTQAEQEDESLTSLTGLEEMVINIWGQVLDVDAIGVHDNFFDIGGHSLLATQVVSRVRESLNVQMEIGSIFEHPTVAELAEAVAAEIRGGASVQAEPIKPANRKKQKLPLSYAQQRLWFLDRLMPGTALYSVPILYRFNGELKIQALEQSLSEIIRRHEALRTRIEVVAGTPVQVIDKPRKLKLEVFNLDEPEPRKREAELQRVIRTEWQQPFDLERGPFLRARLIRLSDREHVLQITMHHIVADGWSMDVLTRELVDLYELYGTGTGLPLEDLKIQYADYAVWQRRWLQGEVLERQLRYWKQQLAGAQTVLELPVDKPRPAVQSHSGAGFLFSLSEELDAELKELCRAESATLFMTLLAAFSVLLSRYSGQAEVLIGTPIANRSRGELEGLIGFFTNTLVMRARLDGNPSFREALRRMRKVCLEAYAHQDVPFERLVEELEPERDLSRTPLFQVMFSLLNAGGKRIELPGLSISPSVIDTDTAKFDLSLGIFVTKQGLKGAFEYNTDLFEAATIERMTGHLLTLLQAVCRHPELPISDLPLLTAAEEQQLFLRWNDTGREYPREQAIQQLFEQQATLTPDATALIFDTQRLTYRELNERANQLAHYLRAQGVSTETLVGLLMERSVELVVGLLGILKAGGAYVPLDVQYPRERLEFMLEDTQAAVLVTQQGLVEQLPEHRSRVVCLDTQWAEIASHSKENPKPGVTAENLAYVIYTSGSTGRPKGVAIEHRSALIFLHWAVEVFTPEQLAGVLASTSICFDLSVFEIFAPLSRGGKIILSENALALPSLPAANQVTLINTVPSAIAELSRMKGIPPSVQTVNLAGEALKNSLVQEVYQQQTIRQVFNLYGPSEDTTYSTYALIKKGPDEQVSIGRPVANTQVYLLDSHQQPVAQGMPGELFIGGAGLARGYLNRPELTAERFIPNPFSQQPGARLYRTGDLARYLPDGRIEYLGRSDHQVKLRGYRIELGEIEAVLAAHAGVREAVAIVRHAQGSDARLVAYLVAEQGHAVTGGQFRDYLKEKLPPYMIPSAFVMLPALPLTPNGKVNRAVLPEPDDVRPQLATDFVMPRTEAEAAVAQVWQEILNLDHVGVNDNFFDLGGHSLLMVQAHSKLREQFTTELTVIDLFKYPTVSTLAEFISKDAVTLTVTRPALEARQAEVEMPQPAIAHLDTAIAIIGMAGRFPGAKNLVEFWENLRQGVESISSFAGHELESPDLDPALLDDENFVRAGAVLDDVDLFDAPFFDFNPREAEITDPQQRLFLECAWEALEQSGYAAESYDGRIGVFAGIGMNGYLQNLYANPEVLRSTSAFQIAIGNDKDYLPTRLSYKLNLKGPSVNVQTACSTSLVAVHIACQSLLNRECEIALAGAISVRTPQKVGYYYQEGGINSPDGHCRAFDAQAQGTVPGNGGGIVVLKRLADARADGDVIHAVILGSMINNDGSAKVCYTAPSVEGQAEVVAGAQRAAGIEPDTITYIEAHGTGTPLGDPIELAALTQAFRSQTNRKAFCAVGSIKTNLGHLDAGAGMAGLIKTVLALKHRMIPPSLHFADPNPSSDLQNSPFYVNRMLREWITDGIPRRAGVSSFGIGGTNAHLILEEAPPRVAAQSSNGPHLLLLSAKTRSALDTMTVNLRDHLQQHDELDPGDVAYTLQVGRRGFNHRRMLVCPDAEDAVAQLSNPNANRMLTATVEPRHRPVVMMYPGQGAQYVNMAAGLYKWNAVFRKHVDVCAELLMPHLGLDLRRVLYPSDAELESAASQLNQTYLAQPALFVIEYALTQLWMELGVKPQAMIGHSIGEFVAACIAEVFTLEDALKLVAARGRLMQALPQGAMLIVPLPEQQVKQLLNAELSIAAVNGPSLCIVSGPTPAIDELERELNARGAEGQRLHTSHAFHSGMMEPAIKPFVELVKQIGLHPPKIPYISNVTGRWITAAQVMEPNYWGEHLRQTVRFADGLSELLKDPSTVVLEAGPGKGMSGLARQQMSQEGERIACSTLRAAKGREPDEASFLHAAGALWLAGIRLNWTGLYGDERPHRVALPTYPFERKRYWVEAATGKAPESPRRNESQELSLSNNLTPAPTETLAVTATERREPLAVQLEGPEFVAVPAPLEWREAVAQQHRHNGKRHGTVQRIITQQLQINARQLELMAQQLELLRNGKANNRKPTGPQSN